MQQLGFYIINSCFGSGLFCNIFDVEKPIREEDFLATRSIANLNDLVYLCVFRTIFIPKTINDI